VTITITQLPIVPSIATKAAKSVIMERLLTGTQRSVLAGNPARQLRSALLVNQAGYMWLLGNTKPRNE
jgi:hypothetical protein